MKMQTIPADAAPAIHVRAIPGDLRVAGWDRNEIMAKTDGDELELVSGSDPLIISCDEDLIIYLPRGASIKIEKVAGDTSIQALNGTIEIGQISGNASMHDIGPLVLDQVSGDFSLRNIANLKAVKVGGDLTLRGCKGDCTIDVVGSDASIRDVTGQVIIPSIGSDLYLRKVDGAINVKAGADVVLFIDPHAGLQYRVTAGDDLLMRLPPEASARLHLSSSIPDSIRIDFPGVDLGEEQSAAMDVTLGNGEAEFFLTAGDDLLITSQADQWDSAADFGVGMKDSGSWDFPPIPPIPPLPPDFSERINRRVQAALERSQSRVEAGGRRAEAAMRRAEAKARAAEVRARRGSAQMNVGRWTWNLGADPNSAAPVTDEERLTILRMLQEKKISLEDAEKLLAALEGK